VVVQFSLLTNAIYIFFHFFPFEKKRKLDGHLIFFVIDMEKKKKRKEKKRKEMFVL
jgi:hypothetical protein